MSSEFLRIQLRRRLLDNPDFFVGEAVELVDQRVNPPVRRVDLTPKGGLFVGSVRRLLLF